MTKSKFLVSFEFAYSDTVYIYFEWAKWTLDAAYDFRLVFVKPVTYKLVFFS